MQSIAPVTLAPGQYTIVAVGYGATEQNGNQNEGGGYPLVSTNTGGGLLTFNSSRPMAAQVSVCPPRLSPRRMYSTRVPSSSVHRPAGRP